MTEHSSPRSPAFATPRWLRRRSPAEAPVTASSIALFRLGEQCNNKCPMCSNSGRPEAFFPPASDLLRRADFLAGQGLRRVVLTGGEPTIHPAFWSVVTRLGEHSIAWDINTHGRSFAEPTFTERAVSAGLLRAIVSLHSHLADVSQVISGVSHRGHSEILGGIDELRGAGSGLLLNCVVTTLNAAHLPEFLDFCCERWGTGYGIKFTFPSTTGKGGAWSGLDLRYAAVQATVREVQQRADARGASVVFESFPNCVLGDANHSNVGRSGFGETHYLDDITGDKLYPIRHIESELSVYPQSCRGCRALPRCPGIAATYAKRYGGDELTPFL